jgi:Protein of unknown function (DUF2800)
LIVTDAKFGHGKVEVEGNTQLMLYALAALAEYYEFAWPGEIILRIYQPAHGGLSIWTPTHQELLDFQARVTEAADLIDGEYPKRIPGDVQCQWCDAKAQCPELVAEVASTIQGSPTATSEASAFATKVVEAAAQGAVLPLEELFAKATMVEQWVVSIKAAAYAAAERGDLPGYKLIEGVNGARVWADEAAALEAIKRMRPVGGEATYTRQMLMTPPQLEAAWTKSADIRWQKMWTKLQPHITQARNKPRLVPESHKSPAIAKAVPFEVPQDSMEEEI